MLSRLAFLTNGTPSLIFRIYVIRIIANLRVHSTSVPLTLYPHMSQCPLPISGAASNEKEDPDRDIDVENASLSSGSSRLPIAAIVAVSVRLG